MVRLSDDMAELKAGLLLIDGDLEDLGSALRESREETQNGNSQCLAEQITLNTFYNACMALT